MSQTCKWTPVFLCCCLVLAVAMVPIPDRTLKRAPVGPLNERDGNCSCEETVSTYPYVADFEADMGGWINVDGDDFDWDRNQGSTPTDNTGPDSDHTFGTGEGYYVFTEASGDNYPDKTAIFVGPCFDLASLSAPEMAFWYHMAGDSMGSLYLEISNDDCANWDVAWEMHDHQGYDWNFCVVDLSAYSGQTIAVQFRGVTADGYESDMALDDIYVGEAVDYLGGCCDLDTGNCLGLMAESACLASGNTAWYLVSDCSEENFCPQPPPANDLCENATVIDALPFADLGVDFKWATPDVPVSCNSDGCEESNYGVWYQYTPVEYCGARIRMDAVTGGTNTFIAIFTGSDCDNLTEVFCSSEQESSAWQEVTFDMDGGVTYWILIGSYWCEGQPDPALDISFNCSLGACCLGDVCSLETITNCEDAGGYYFGDDTICDPNACLHGACCTSNGCEELSEADCAAAGGVFHNNGVPCELDTCPPVNETCATAIVVTNGTPAAVGDTTLASFEDDEEASCQDSSDKDLWYAYTATCTGTVSIDTEGSEIWDTILSVWNECGGEEIACETDGPSGSLAALEFEAIAGQTYYIRFAPLFGISGMFQINISCTEGGQGACCFGDTCVIDYQLPCENAGGLYGGDDTVCDGEDCNLNGISDICDILNGPSEDCNGNLIPDECDIAAGNSLDLDGNGVPDECDPDCNGNGIIDGCDLSCDGGCADIEGCGGSLDCQGDGIPDECQLEIEGCGGVRYDSGYGDLVDGVRPNYGWANYGMVDDFTLDQDESGTCFRFDIYDFAGTESFPVMRVRVYENPSGLMALGDFWQATPVIDETYSTEDGTLEITDTGENLYIYDLLRFVGSGPEWELNAGDYAIHLTFPETGDAGFWATSGTDDSDCAAFWGDWWSWPSEACDEDVDLTRLSFALLGSINNDCNEDDIPDDCQLAGNDCNGNGVLDECDIANGTSSDCDGNGIPDECELCGDLDKDGDVDAADYAIFRDAFGGPVDGVPPEDYCCDYDGTGAVGLIDFAIWLECYRDYVGDASAEAPRFPRADAKRATAPRVLAPNP